MGRGAHGLCWQSFLTPTPCDLAHQHADQLSLEFLKWLPENLHIWYAFVAETFKIIGRVSRYHEAEGLKMRYLSVCSGIEAATVAWHPLGWEPVAFSDIEAFPRAVLNHHYPHVPLHGDFTTIGENDYGSIDLLVGGTPCQSFSIAGLRKGLGDDRGNLTLEFILLAQRLRPRWVVWENVPGILSIDGRAFGAFLGGLAELGYGFAYRILDAQYFGVPQRRRRVFVVGYLGDWRVAAAVLFESESLQRDITPRRETRKKIADSLTVSAN